MSGKFENYRRGPGSVDPGADHGRQLGYLERQANSYADQVAASAAQGALDAALLAQPPFGKILAVSAPADTSAHAVAHGLGYAFVGALVLGYSIAGAHVLILKPSWVVALPDDPAVNFYYVNQYTITSLGNANLGAVDFDVWVF